MKKLTKEQVKRWYDAINEAREVGEKLDTLIAEANAAMTEALVGIEAHIQDYNDLVAVAEEVRLEVVADIEDYTGQRSERWHEGERAEQYDTWRGAWEEIETTGIDPPGFAPQFDLEVAYFDDWESAPQSLEEATG